MFIIRQNLKTKSIRSLLRLYSIGRKNHYDILNLRRNCSDKEIKDAFIKLSKEFHPDKNKDVKAQEKFVNIVEAYNVLGKPSTRAQYDNTIVIETNNPNFYRTHVPYNLRKKPQYNNSFYGSEYNQANTYGTTGIRRIPNYIIIAICTGIALIGVFLQVFVIRGMYIMQRKEAQERSQRLAEELEAVRSAALKNGNEMQTRILMDKIVTAANPTVATASLGQALVSEKK